ncbi:MAG: ABC transporter ATP-binding protein [Methanosarcinales archaeon]|nr:ABC transporter ATP-binding protein [Methanosarcinales archaeon]
MLEINDLTLQYTADFVESGIIRVLDGISFYLKKGESIGIIGESGSGKTSLGMAVMGLSGGEVSGEIRFGGVNLLDLTDEEMRVVRWNRISMVMQNTGNVLNPAYTVEEQITEPITKHGLDSKIGAQERASLLLREVGLDSDKLNAYPVELSGGERQQVLIAMALANDPELIIMDEPTASLDVLTRRRILGLLDRIKEERSLLVISHDASTVASLENLIVLYSGRVMEAGKTDLLLKDPRHPYTRDLLRAHPFMDTTKDLQGIRGKMPTLYDLPTGCRFSTRCTQKIAICEERPPELTGCRVRGEDGSQDGDGGTYRRIACHRGGIHTLLQVNSLNKEYQNRSRNRSRTVAALNDISFELQVGEIVALVGATGCGKSTLAKVVTRIFKPDSGEIFYDGEEIHAIDAKRFHKDVQMIFQDPLDAVNTRFHVLKIVREPLEIQGKIEKQEMIRKVKHTLDEINLPSDDIFLKKYPHQLSGGELQRVTIARALITDPKLLIADEPTAYLDPSVQAKILKLLMRMQNTRGMTMLFITHDIALARKVSDRIFVMREGDLVEQGVSSDVIYSPKHVYTKELVYGAEGAAGYIYKSIRS